MTLTAEQRSAQARKAIRTRWAMAWNTPAGRRARSAAYSQRIIRAIATGNPWWLTREDRLRIGRALNGSANPRDFLLPPGKPAAHCRPYCNGAGQRPVLIRIRHTRQHPRQHIERQRRTRDERDHHHHDQDGALAGTWRATPAMVLAPVLPASEPAP